MKEKAWQGMREYKVETEIDTKVVRKLGPEQQVEFQPLTFDLAFLNMKSPDPLELLRNSLPSQEVPPEENFRQGKVEVRAEWHEVVNLFSDSVGIEENLAPYVKL